MPMLYSMGYPPKKVKKPKHFLLDSRSFAVPHSGRGGGDAWGTFSLGLYRWPIRTPTSPKRE